jgi:DNA-binding response OmpR family regulator
MGCSQSVLIVEDDTLIALDLQSLLENAGYSVIGPVGSVEAAMRLLKHAKPDFALLDINLGKTNSFPLADLLAADAVPIIFVTAHSRRVLHEEHANRPVVEKPFLPDTLLAVIRSTTAALVLRDDRLKAASSG